MRESSRWSVLRRLCDAMTRTAERSEIRRLQEEEIARSARLGDTDGQTRRALMFAERLEALVLVDIADPVVAKPAQWPVG